MAGSMNIVLGDSGAMLFGSPAFAIPLELNNNKKEKGELVMRFFFWFHTNYIELGKVSSDCLQKTHHKQCSFLYSSAYIASQEWDTKLLSIQMHLNPFRLSVNEEDTFVSFFFSSANIELSPVSGTKVISAVQTVPRVYFKKQTDEQL